MKELYKQSKKRLYIVCIISSILLAFIVFINLFYIPSATDIADRDLILFKLRIPRIILAIIAGAGLAVVGTSFQGLFKNPLAEPYLLGVSAGAAFGAVIGFYFNLQNLKYAGEFIIIINSFIGGIISIGMVILISNFRKNFNILSLILTGVIMNALLFSIQFLIIAISYGRLHNVLLWIWGKIPAVNYYILGLLIILFIISYFKILLNHQAITLFSISEKMAESKGINIKKVSLEIIIFATIIVASIVSICGIIGFVGLVVPHIVRLLIGHNFKNNLILSPIIGAIFMLIADFISRYILYPSVLPVGIVTSLIGAPLFFYLLKRNIK